MNSPDPEENLRPLAAARAVLLVASKFSEEDFAAARDVLNAGGPLGACLRAYADLARACKHAGASKKVALKPEQNEQPSVRERTARSSPMASTDVKDEQRLSGDGEYESLRRAAINQLVGNTELYPDRAMIAGVRKRWTSEPLVYPSKQGRTDLAKRLVAHLEKDVPDVEERRRILRQIAAPGSSPAERASRMYERLGSE